MEDMDKFYETEEDGCEEVYEEMEEEDTPGACVASKDEKLLMKLKNPKIEGDASNLQLWFRYHFGTKCNGECEEPDCRNKYPMYNAIQETQGARCYEHRLPTDSNVVAPRCSCCDKIQFFSRKWWVLWNLYARLPRKRSSRKLSDERKSCR